VRHKHLVPLYQRVVEWMLKRDLLVGLHLRVRVVAPASLKLRVRDRLQEARLRAQARRRRRRSSQLGAGRPRDLAVIVEPSSDDMYVSLSPHAARERMRRLSSVGSAGRVRPLALLDAEALEDEEDEDEWERGEEDDDDVGEEESNLDDVEPSVIADPRKATSMQRRWLSAMSDGKDPGIARRFEEWVVSIWHHGTLMETLLVAGSTAISTVSGRTMRYFIEPRCRGSSCAKCSITTMNTCVFR
jgi:nitrogen permease regulator 3-like protein